MAEEEKKRPKQKPRERPAEPRSPGAAIETERPDLPGEGGMPRREDMGPGDHRPREEGGDKER